MHDARPTSPACALDPVRLGVRQARWRDARRHVEIVERNRVAGAFRITFRGPRSAIEAIESLVASERECCAWAAWHVHGLGDRVMLEVRAPEDLIMPLARAFGIVCDHRR